jgi:hypothetical protein
MIILAYFFLLQPGEYTDNDGDTDKHPFLLEDVQFFIGDTRLNLLTDPDSHLSPQAQASSICISRRRMGFKEKSLA